MHRRARLGLLTEQTMALLILAIVGLFTYAYLVQVPYAGFRMAQGRIREVFNGSTLQSDDELVQVGPVAMAAFRTDLRLTLFDGAQPGQVVPLLVRRDGQLLSVPWVYPGFTRQQLLPRLTAQWWLALVFWLFGELTLLLVHPKDTRWKLLAAFNLVTAIWLSASASSGWHTWRSAIALRAAVWLAVPVYLHFHWIFPRPLARPPAAIWWVAYLAGVTLAAGEWLRLLPIQAYVAGFLLALGGSLCLLATHFVRHRAERGEIGLVLAAGGLALGLPLGLGILEALGLRPPAALASLLALPLLPGAYFYAAYRRQLAGLELRANRLIAAYLFLLLLVAVFAPLLALAENLPDFPSDTLVISLGAVVLAATTVMFGFASFQRFVERRLLGMPLAPTNLLESFATEITVSLDTPRLVELLRDRVLPSLLVRQSALLRFEPAGPAPLYASGVDAGQLPAADDVPALLAEAGQYRAPTTTGPCPWVRLVLPLTFGRQPLGLWLLGRRDPDDFYAQTEIASLQALAHQTAIALTNIVQAERLHALYQDNIDETEAERTALARRLHDQLLNQLALLKLSLDNQPAPAEFHSRYNGLVTGIRQIIHGLRPPMLNYGLRPALGALADEVAERTEDGPEIVLDLPVNGPRYDPQVELHLYRIVQQAVENALEHARARTIKIEGRLEPDGIELCVADDGVGVASGERLDLAGLVERRHFGLVGMFERAALVAARLQIVSAPGRGAQVRVIWNRDGR